MKEEIQNNSQVPDNIKQTLDICAKAILVIPAGSFFISICSNVAFFSGLGIGLSAIPFSIYDFIMAFRMWFAIFILLCIFSYISFTLSKFASFFILIPLDYLAITFKSKFINFSLEVLKTTVSRNKIRLGDLALSIIVICFLSFLKGASYSGNHGNVYVKQEDSKAPTSTIDGSIIALDKGILLKQSDNMITFIFNDKIVKIEYNTHAKSFSEILLNIL